MIKKERKLLVVDDNIDFINFIRRALDGEDYKLSIALNGNTAIDKAAKENPDLVLLDLKLPDLDGEEVLERMRRDNKEISVVVITGYGDDQVAVDMMKKGAIDFLTKPVEPQILVKAIKNALEIREAQQEEKQLELFPSLERFFPFFAHEIRNPLHAISGALTIIQRRSNLDDEILAQSISIINEEIQHLNEFVQECLNFVRPPNKVRFVEVDINEVIHVVINIITHIFERESNAVRVVTEMDPFLPKIHSNYEVIKQAFLNIVKNAYEAMPRGGDLMIRTIQKSDSPRYVEIIFADNGVGIKKESLPSLFNPFFTTKPLGTGLGLAVCRRIIAERNNGKILIESEEGKGTTVKVRLPIGPPSEESPEKIDAI
jgi:signal transduction histidine kinase